MQIVRIMVFALSVVSAVAIAFSVGYALDNWQRLQQAQANLVQAERNIADLKKLETQIEVYTRYQQQLKQVNAKVSDLQLIPEMWTYKEVAIKNLTIPRNSVMGFLRGMSQKPDQFFKPDEFSLKTVSQKDDLFHWRGDDSSDSVNLKLMGEYVIRRAL
ncbi:MAG: hypothetical protein RI556_01520 [Hydrogenovibrio sp.]|uniref:hypothetical protein n=1 Tax=Hydrogenovibrio sp. TaxID=2065821 RepID=UPI002870294B|nr:hypothetical protein [Hydrogenovibrio sp.]MDR9497827.1 hypothetical protein [Hydrogenovibrio sp.]